MFIIRNYELTSLHLLYACSPLCTLADLSLILVICHLSHIRYTLHWVMSLDFFCPLRDVLGCDGRRALGSRLENLR